MRYRFDEWELDWDNRVLSKDCCAVDVEPKVLHFIRVMLENHGRLVARDELASILWPDVLVGPDALVRIVKEARRVLGDSGTDPKLIVTRRGFGYQFTQPVLVLEDEGKRRSFGSGTSRSQRSSTHDLAQQTTAADLEPGRVELAIQWLVPCLRRTLIHRNSRTTLGRSSGSSEVLDGLGTSRDHAECFYQGPVAVIRDLGSRNGTYLNGRLIDQEPLAPNDVVRIGGWVGVVRAAGADNLMAPKLWAPGYWATPAQLGLIDKARIGDNALMPINVWGEPGCGKSALAKAIHDRSRIAAPCVVLRCGGHHSPGTMRRSGTEEVLSVSAHTGHGDGSTLILEGIDELDESQRAWLTSALGVAGAQTLRPSRIITTSKIPVSQLGTDKVLSPGLLRLVAGIELNIPSLRQDREHILGLLRIFFEENSGSTRLTVSGLAAERLLLHAWPMNVAELKQVASTMSLTLGMREFVDQSDLPAELNSDPQRSAFVSRVG